MAAESSLQHAGFSYCGGWALDHVGSVVAASGILVPLTKTQTLVPCIGRWILKHWTAMDVPSLIAFLQTYMEPEFSLA